MNNQGVQQTIERNQNRHKRTRNHTFWVLIDIIILIIVAILSGIFTGTVKYQQGRHYQEQCDEKYQAEHPHIRIEYRKHHLIKKRVPMVHIEDASSKQVEKAVNKAHNEDIHDFERILKKDGNNMPSSDNNSSSNDKNSKSSNSNQKSKNKETISQALQDQAKADHSSENVK